MNERRKWQALLGLMGVSILLLGLAACSQQPEPAEDSTSAVLQARNITVYESPT